MYAILLIIFSSAPPLPTVGMEQSVKLCETEPRRDVLNKALIVSEQAIQTIEATTNMKMPLRTNEATYIRFVELSNSGACGSANIGKLSQSQVTFQYGFPYSGQPVSVKSNSGTFAVHARPLWGN